MAPLARVKSLKDKSLLAWAILLRRRPALGRIRSCASPLGAGPANSV